MLRIGVLVSGGGTTLQALLDAQEAGAIRNGRIVRVISSKPGAFALDRAKRHGIETAVVERKACESPEEFDAAILRELEGCGADIVVLAGFLSILGPTVISRYENRILNVHPALIPSFCGKGYYGLRVHEEALRYGVKLTGATVHLSVRCRMAVRFCCKRRSMSGRTTHPNPCSAGSWKRPNGSSCPVLSPSSVKDGCG